MGTKVIRGCMDRLRSSSFALAAAIISVSSILGCGGHKPAGVSPYPAKITITPAVSISLELGTALNFTASAQNGTGNTVNLTFQWQSSDSSIVNVSPAGAVCAGHWDSTYSICTPGGIGTAAVTATAAGAVSPPTYVFAHPTIDNIVVTGILPQSQVLQEPCLSQGQAMTVQAQAFSQGLDITASVGPFTWIANNTGVVTLTPIISNFTFNVPTNQATATAAAPGITYIYATAGGVTSNSFQQPQYVSGGTMSPLLNFFETCPIQNIWLQVGATGSQQTTQTSFVASKGTLENVTAIVTDAVGNTSVVNSNTPAVLSTIPLTWTSTQPGVVGVGSGCTLNCSISTPSPGAAAVTASCSPPTCNIGYPEIPPILTSPQCALFFGSCTQFIPLPVYATPATAPNEGGPAISGLVTGATGAASVLATSNGCQFTNPLDCSTSIYNVSTSKPVAGSALPMPSSPTSLLFDPAGDKVYVGSEVAATSLNPASLGTSNSAFTSLGPVTGKVLAVSENGSLAVFSDTTLQPNRVFVVNQTSASSPAVNVLDINNASVAAFSPDNLKAFIFGFDNTGLPNLYVYSTAQGLVTIPLGSGTIVNSIAFSNNGAFAYVVESSVGGGGPGFSVYNTCQLTPGIATSSPATLGGPPPNDQSQAFPLTASPISFKALPDGTHFVALEAGGAIDYLTAIFTGQPPAPVPNTFNSYPAISLCPTYVNNNSVAFPIQHISLNQGTITPLDFFTSPDESLLYVVAADRATVLVYNFGTGATTGISLVNNALPIQVGMAADGGTIIIAGSDGYLHEVSTAIGGADLLQTPFPDLPNYLNPFCTLNPPGIGPCTLNLIAVKP
jgi:hypothetical protein